ncbi:TcpQ domain-containing protein [Salinicola endophyticus]|uniref:TcpQ domain-containing protein n=1 Tax=Salinicola endophyticus TaxID=1949083 RepID=A0AB74UBR7_9GAMM
MPMSRVSLATITLVTVLSGCQSTQTVATPPVPKPAPPKLLGWEAVNSTLAPDDDQVKVSREGRYTLVSARPRQGQRDLLQQSIEINIPAGVEADVGTALRYVLDESGYTLFGAVTDAQRRLYSRPLPAAHHHLGPMPLSEALQLLAGEPWQLYVDRVGREVTYRLPKGMRWQSPAKVIVARHTEPGTKNASHQASAVPRQPGGDQPQREMTKHERRVVSTHPAKGEPTSSVAPTPKPGAPSPQASEATAPPPSLLASISTGSVVKTPLPRRDTSATTRPAAPPAKIEVATAIAAAGSTAKASPQKKAAIAPVTQARAIPEWTLDTGQSLREGLDEWSTRAHWRLVWSADYDYQLRAPLRFSGDFLAALQSVSETYRRAKRPLYVDTYPSQRLVVVSPMRGND